MRGMQAKAQLLAGKAAEGLQEFLWGRNYFIYLYVPSAWSSAWKRGGRGPRLLVLIRNKQMNTFCN